MKTIDPTLIKRDFAYYPRAEVNEEVVAEYVEAMKRGDEFPPVLLYWDGKTEVYTLADGFHRFQAWQTINPSAFIPAKIKLGTDETARWAAIGANQDHGLRRTNADKRRAVELALLHPKGVNKSNRLIARYVGVDEGTVRNVRYDLEATAEIPQSYLREGADGRLIDTAQIGENAPSNAEHDPISHPVAMPTEDSAIISIFDERGERNERSSHVNSNRKSGAINVPLYEDNPSLSAVEIRHMLGSDWLSELYTAIPPILLKTR